MWFFTTGSLQDWEKPQKSPPERISRDFYDVELYCCSIKKGYPGDVIFVIFSADDYSKQLFRSLAVVDHNGSVFWAPPTKFRSACPVNVMYFPFDDQTCHLKLSSWMYDVYTVSCPTQPHPALNNKENKY